MEFFCFHRDRRGSRALRNALLEEHWSYMDQYWYLVLGFGSGHATDLAVPPDQDELIEYGPLLSDDGTTWLGTAALVRATNQDTLRAVLTADRYGEIEVTAGSSVGVRDRAR